MPHHGPRVLSRGRACHPSFVGIDEIARVTLGGEYISETTLLEAARLSRRNGPGDAPKDAMRLMYSALSKAPMNPRSTCSAVAVGFSSPCLTAVIPLQHVFPGTCTLGLANLASVAVASSEPNLPCRSAASNASLAVLPIQSRKVRAVVQHLLSRFAQP